MRFLKFKSSKGFASYNSFVLPQFNLILLFYLSSAISLQFNIRIVKHCKTRLTSFSKRAFKSGSPVDNPVALGKMTTIHIRNIHPKVHNMASKKSLIARLFYKKLLYNESSTRTSKNRSFWNHKGTCPFKISLFKENIVSLYFS